MTHGDNVMLVTIAPTPAKSCNHSTIFLYSHYKILVTTLQHFLYENDRLPAQTRKIAFFYFLTRIGQLDSFVFSRMSRLTSSLMNSVFDGTESSFSITSASAPMRSLMTYCFVRKLSYFFFARFCASDTKLPSLSCLCAGSVAHYTL